MQQLFNRIWYEKHPLVWVLLPFSLLFCLIVWLRRVSYRTGFKRSRHFDIPVVVVGNLTVGGTGKTPLVAWLAEYLIQQGYRPGIISRGWGGNAKHWPQQVRHDSDPVAVGDEAVLLARQTGCPVATGPGRNDAIESIVEHTDCNIIISDDGLQHLSMQRTLEIVLVDGIRRFGNGFCLPAGPLRESAGRLKHADIIVTRGTGGHGEFGMTYRAGKPRRLVDERYNRSIDEFKGQPVHAVAGIGNPRIFFSQLRKLGLQIIEHVFPDHHDFSKADVEFSDGYEVIMTEKDAVKCIPFASKNHWYLPINAILPSSFETRLTVSLKKRIANGYKTA